MDAQTQQTLVGVLTGNLFVVAALALVTFFILREISLWFWKVNRIVELLEDIRENTDPNPIKDEEECEDGAGERKGATAVKTEDKKPS
jgi:hypothetical protein